jgi:sarcosine oxidase gamma subunit
VARSPLERALRSGPRGIRFHDLSLTLAKLEVRGDLDAIGVVDVIRITPRRGLVLAPAAKGKALEAKLRKQAATVVDRTGALAGLRVEGAQAATLMRRLTDLDLERLPAAGAVGRVPALVRGGGEAFELFWPQEYGHHLAQVVLDAAEGLA